MVLRPGTKITTKKSEHRGPVEEIYSPRKLQELGQYRLQVDRQTKASFSTFEAAEEAGLKIKREHPVVRVAVYDAVGGENRIVETPKEL
jgi:hypothetical protein